MRRIALFVVALLVMGVVGLARAHEVRPGYLELRQTGPEIYDVLWKVPARGDLRLGLYVRLPENCQPITPKAHYGAGGAFLERSQVFEFCGTDHDPVRLFVSRITHRAKQNKNPGPQH